MTLLVVADDESVLATLPDTRADILISCGDVPDEMILACARHCSCDTVFAVRGNHDSSGSFAEGIIDLHLRTEQRNGTILEDFAVPGDISRAEITSSSNSKLAAHCASFRPSTFLLRTTRRGSFTTRTTTFIWGSKPLTLMSIVRNQSIFCTGTSM